MAEIKYKIDGVDFSDVIKMDGGLKWKKFDLESDQAGRTLDTMMHRARIGKKRQLTHTCKPKIPDARLRQLCAALDHEFVQITYPDPQLGPTTKTFYGTEIEAAVMLVQNGSLYWNGVTYVLTER